MEAKIASIYGFILKNRKSFQGLDWQGNQDNLCYKGNKVAWYEEYREMHGDKWTSSNRLFIGEYVGNIYLGTINMWMKRICQTAGLEERTVHSLRHTNITMQIAAGVPVVTIAGRAGHARTSTTTDIYSYFLKTADHSAVQKLEEIFE